MIKYSSLISLIPAILVLIMARYPFIQNLTVTGFTMSNGTCSVSGTMNVYFTQQAYEQFGYAKGNFYYFNAWWQNQTGKVISLDGIDVVLVSVNWTILKHTDAYDTLRFQFVLGL